MWYLFLPFHAYGGANPQTLDPSCAQLKAFESIVSRQTLNVNPDPQWHNGSQGEDQELFSAEEAVDAALRAGPQPSTGGYGVGFRERGRERGERERREREVRERQEV